MAARADQTAQGHLDYLQKNILDDPRYRNARAAIHRSIKLKKPTLPPLADGQGKPSRKFVVRLVEMDTFAAAQELRLQYPREKIACLNHANAQYPGGGFLGGSVAQEEDLCHCSTLHLTLHKKFYPIQPDELIYSPDVLVIKAKDPSAPGGRRWLSDNERFSVDVISSAALQSPKTTMGERYGNDGFMIPYLRYSSHDDRLDMYQRIRLIVQAAVQNGVKRLVLGAFGCGVFGNPRHDVATMMKDILLECPPGIDPETDWTEYGLQEVVIAIFDPTKQTFGAFMHEWRTGGGLHLAGRDPLVPEPEMIQYTAFAPREDGEDGADGGTAAA